MKKPIYTATRASLFAIGASLFAAAATAQPLDKPNVIIIYGDDVGYGDVGAYGSKLIPTPNLDRLAAEGIRFTDGHATASTCTPSRYGMLTGRHGFPRRRRYLAADGRHVCASGYLDHAGYV